MKCIQLRRGAEVSGLNEATTGGWGGGGMLEEEGRRRRGGGRWPSRECLGGTNDVGSASKEKYRGIYE